MTLDKHPLWWLYNAGLTLSWPWLALYYELRARTDGKYGRSRRVRLGLALPRETRAAKRLWCHALSVGETLSALPLIMTLRQAHPDLEIHFSTATEAGFEIARRRIAPCTDQVFLLGHDFLWSTRTTVKRLRPDLFILIETDWWPNMLWALRESHVPMVLVNGRLSPKSFWRFKRMTAVVSPMLGNFELVFAQSRRDARYYRELGVAAERVMVPGNLKFDLAVAGKFSGNPEDFRREVGIGDHRPIWIAGSIHPGEDEILLSVHRRLLEALPDLLLVVAPRQPARAESIARLCCQFALTSARRSRRPGSDDFSVFILDTLGELAAFYSISDAAFIGGSLVSFGGHNPLEAVVYGQPVCWGPHLFNFREIEQNLVERDCGRRVHSGEELYQALRGWLQGPQSRRETAAKVRQLLKQGCAAQRVVNSITKFLT